MIPEPNSLEDSFNKPISISIKNPIQAHVTLLAKKNLNGNIVVYDHPDLDVIFDDKKSRIILYPKKNMTDHVYNAQKRLLDYFCKKGVVEPKSIRSGNVFFTMEATFFKPENQNISTIDVFLYTIAKFFKKEEPYYQSISYYEDEMEKTLTDPPEDETTELGKVPHTIDKTVDSYIAAGRNNYRTLYEQMS